MDDRKTSRQYKGWQNAILASEEKQTTIFSDTREGHFLKEGKRKKGRKTYKQQVQVTKISASLQVSAKG